MSARYRPPYTTGRPTDYFTPRPDGRFDVAVVGNGPLHESDRVLINRSANVVRFNDMNNFRHGERTSVRVVRYPSALPPRHKCNATVWAVAVTPATLPDRALPLLTWSYEPALTHLYVSSGPVGWAKGYHVFFPSAQVLEPWADTVRVFDGCRSCGIACFSNQTSAGPSTGTLILSELQAMPSVANVSVFGMNWGGGMEHTDFAFPTMVPACCTRCTIHETASDEYGDEVIHWTQDAQNFAATAGVSGIALLVVKLSIGAFAVFHGGRAVQKKLKERAVAADTRAVAQPVHASSDMPLLAVKK